MKKILILSALALSATAFAQQNSPFYSNSGNNMSSTDKLGSTNSAPLRFFTNNTHRGEFSSTGDFFLDALAGQGTGLVTFDNSGKIISLPYPNDATKILLGNGSWSALSTLSGWTISYGGIATSYNVGIGASPDPLYKLNVGGDANISGTVYANGVIIASHVKSDSTHTTNATITNSLTTSNASITGNAGIGVIGTPTEKLEVNGNVKISNGKIMTPRISPLPGDTIIHIGDSSILYNNVRNYYYVDANSNITFKGIGYGTYCYGVGINGVALGYNSRCTGAFSIAHGVDVVSYAAKSMVIGSGANSNDRLINGIPNSLMIGFNSNVPTIFVASANGQLGSTGNVGIGTTTIPPGIKLAVCGTIQSKEVIIDASNWCDFVFDRNYHRMTWQEKLAYINANKHLPAITSEKEIETNGLKTYESMKGMMQNIEENTLDIIDLYQLIKKQNEEIIDLKREISELKQKK